MTICILQTLLRQEHKRKLVLDPDSSLPAMGRLYSTQSFMEVHEGAYEHNVTEYVSWVHTRKLPQELYLKHLIAFNLFTILISAPPYYRQIITLNKIIHTKSCGLDLFVFSPWFLVHSSIYSLPLLHFF